MSDQARRCAEQNADHAAGRRWVGNQPWIKAAADNWNRLNAGQPTRVVAAPQAANEAEVKALIDQNIVGVYE